MTVHERGVAWSTYGEIKTGTEFSCGNLKGIYQFVCLAVI
jgi:hypothetical protein